MHVWATTIGEHVRTLRQAAHDGRLGVSYGARTFFDHTVPLATGTAVRRFKARTTSRRRGGIDSPPTVVRAARRLRGNA